LNQRPPGYEPDELPGCSTPRPDITRLAAVLQLDTPLPHSSMPRRELLNSPERVLPCGALPGWCGGTGRRAGLKIQRFGLVKSSILQGTAVVVAGISRANRNWLIFAPRESLDFDLRRKLYTFAEGALSGHLAKAVAQTLCPTVAHPIVPIRLARVALLPRVSEQNIWRRGWDSNPRLGFPNTRFPSVLLKPLGHLSGLQSFSSLTN
jgi:hypothetical protein